MSSQLLLLQEEANQSMDLLSLVEYPFKVEYKIFSCLNLCEFSGFEDRSFGGN